MVPWTPPGVEWHNPMMKHVKKRQMCKLFLEQENDRVYHVNQLGHIEYPSQVESSESLRIVGIVNRLTLPAVIATHVETLKRIVRWKWI